MILTTKEKLNKFTQNRMLESNKWVARQSIVHPPLILNDLIVNKVHTKTNFKLEFRWEMTHKNVYLLKF